MKPFFPHRPLRRSIFRGFRSLFSIGCLLGTALPAAAQVPCPQLVTTVAPATGPLMLCAGSSITLTASATGPGFDLSGSGTDYQVNAVARQPDGKVLLGGAFNSFNGDLAAPNRILRLNADGTLDTSFNYTVGNTTNGVGMNGTCEVNTIVVQPDGKILVGGSNGGFTDYNGDSSAPDYLMRLNANGTLDQTFNYGTGSRGTNGGVYALALQPDGRILVGGFFTAFNGDSNAPDGLLRLDANGSLDQTFNVGTGARGTSIDFGLSTVLGVRALALQPNGRVVVGGRFLAYNGDAGAANNLVRVNANGSLDQTFNYTVASTTTGTNEYVAALALRPNGKIVVGGNTTAYNGDVAAADGVFQLTATGVLDQTFNYTLGSTATGTAGGGVFSLALQPDDKLLVGGFFGNYNGLLGAPDNLLRLNPNGSLDTGFNYTTATNTSNGTSNYVYALVVQPDGRILAGGAMFNFFNRTIPVPAGIARFNPDGSLGLLGDPIVTATYAWSTGSTGPTLTVTQPGTYVPRTTNGGCTSYGNAVTVVAAPTATVIITPSGSTTVPAGGSVLLTAAATLAGFNVGGSGLTPTVEVEATQVLPDGKVLAGGNFQNYNGNAAAPDHLLRLNADGTLDNTFNSGGSGFNSAVYALAVQPDGKIVVGGGFSSYNGNAAAPDGLVRLNADGTLDNTFAPTLPNLGVVRALALQADGKVLVGGAPGNYLRRLNPDGSLDTGFNVGGSGPAGQLYAIVVQPDGRILIGGLTTGYNGVAGVEPVMRLNANGSRDQTFAPNGVGAGNGTHVLALQPDGKVLVGSVLVANLTGAPNGLLRLNANGRLDTSFNSGGAGFSNGNVTGLTLQPDGKIVAVGSFTGYNGNAAAPDGVLRLTASGSLDNTFNGGGTGIGAGNGTALTLQPDGKVIVGGYFTSYNGNAAAPDALIRLNADGTLDNTNTPLPGATFAWNPGNTTGPTRTVTASGTYTATATTAGGCTYASAPVTVTLVTATAAAGLAAQVLLYPNPAGAGTRVVLALPLAAGRTASAEVLNALGQWVLPRQFLTLSGSRATAELPTVGLPAGVYTVRLSTPAGSVSKRLVLE